MNQQERQPDLSNLPGLQANDGASTLFVENLLSSLGERESDCRWRLALFLSRFTYQLLDLLFQSQSGQPSYLFRSSCPRILFIFRLALARICTLLLFLSSLLLPSLDRAWIFSLCEKGAVGGFRQIHPFRHMYVNKGVHNVMASPWPSPSHSHWHTYLMELSSAF